MKIDIFDLSEALNYESRFIFIYNLIEIIFNLENLLIYNNFITY